MGREKELALAMKILDKQLWTWTLACSTMVTVRNRGHDQPQAERRGGAGGGEEAQEIGGQEHDGGIEEDSGILEVIYLASARWWHAQNTPKSS